MNLPPGDDRAPVEAALFMGSGARSLWLARVLDVAMLYLATGKPLTATLTIPLMHLEAIAPVSAGQPARPTAGLRGHF